MPALAYNPPRLAPAPPFLPAVPGRMQGTADRVSADPRQAILGPAQRVPQRRQRPRRRAVPGAFWRPSHFRQNASLLRLAIADLVATTMLRHQGSQAIAVEPRYPAHKGVAGLAPYEPRPHRVTLPLGHGQQGPGTRNLGCRSTLRPAPPGERCPLRLTQRAQGALLPP